MSPQPPNQPALSLHPNAEATALACAHRLAKLLSTAVNSRMNSGNGGGVTVAFSGGTTPARMFGHLASLIAADALTGNPWWNSVEVFQVDERIAPESDPARNANDLTNCLLNPTDTAPRRRHLIPVNDPDGAANYQATLQRLAPKGLDIVVLGLGDDGHTASLVPGDPVVEEGGALVGSTRIYKGHRRITLTLPAIDSAHRALWLVCGAAKAKALSQLMTHDRTIPAGLVATKDQTVFADVDAATALPRRNGQP